jgi:CheY-like chemotaxis protein
MTAKPKTVLIVEDDEDLRRLYRVALRFAGYEVVESGDGLAALYQLDAVRPDCILLDVMLPRMSGYGFSRELAASVAMRDIPIVVVTGAGVDGALLRAACVLRKPAAPQAVVDAIERCIADAGSRANPAET